MSAIDRTGETISLSFHDGFAEEGIFYPPQLDVDIDADSSMSTSAWIYIALTDKSHDSDSILLTLPEAKELHARLGLLLGLVP